MMFAKPILLSLLSLFSILSCVLLVAADEHDHHEHAEEAKMPPPRIFLDKSPRIVAYQLKRLDNARLLMVERKTDGKKYKPIYQAILTRAGMSNQHREHAIKAIAAIDKNEPISVLLQAMDSLDGDDRSERRVTRQLAGLVLKNSKETLLTHLEAILAACKSDNPVMRSAGYASLIAAEESERAKQLSGNSEQGTLDFLGAIVMSKAKLRSELRPAVVGLVSLSHTEPVRRAAVGALGFIERDQADTFSLAATLFDNKGMRDAAVKTMLRIPSKARDANDATVLLGKLVKHAESTPAAKRTSDNFIDTMQLADQLMVKAPIEEAKSYRERLRAVTVRVVVVHTVEEEMRYDIRHFAVEAGRPVQIVLNNEDLMPHNLVVTAPGALKEVAMEGAAVGPTTSVSGKQYVPKSDNVLQATPMVASGQQFRLTFTAPTEPGEYPFVCTFPRHWMRMYGVMIVVDDLDAFAKNPIEPKDPTGNNRSFVKQWTIEDLADKVAEGLRGRSAEIGERIFTQATCAQCHKMNKVGGAVGPELTDVLERWKGDRVGVLREILDPSHKVDPKYALQLVATEDGRVLSGVVVADDKESISIVVNPEDPKPIVVKKDEIEEVIRSTKSLMPKALLDRFTEDEIFELLAYITSGNGAAP